MNGEPAIVLLNPHGLALIAAMEFDGRRIVGMRLVINPDKLTHAAAQLGVPARRV